MEPSVQGKKAGIVCLVGRPNVGKSTLLNAILGHKVAITSPKPQTTRFAIEAVYEDDRGQIVFIDTPGIFGKAPDQLAKNINKRTQDSLENNIDVVLYLIDHTRQRDFEENKALGIVRKIPAKKILVINKSDITKPSYLVQYRFMEDEFDVVIHISALNHKNLNILVENIFDYLPTREPLVDTTTMVQPGLNLDSRVYLSEIIREKAYLFLRKEVPYTLTAVVDEVVERDNGTLYVRGRILTSADRYKSMIIGKGGVMIKEIGMAVRKELETARNKKVFVDLTVEVDPHWADFV